MLKSGVLASGRDSATGGRVMDVIKSSIDNLGEVEEGLQKFYTEGEDGKFRLQAEGLVPKVKLDEFPRRISKAVRRSLLSKRN